MNLNRQMAHYKLAQISEQLTTEQIMNARKWRKWRKFDKLSEDEKLITRLEELEIYQDDIDPNYIPKGFSQRNSF